MTGQHGCCHGVMTGRFPGQGHSKGPVGTAATLPPMIRASGAELFVPAGYDVLWSVVALVQVVLLATALTVWFRARHDRGGGLLDVLVILLVPVLGPAAYLAGRHLARRGAAGGGATDPRAHEA